MEKRKKGKWKNTRLAEVDSCRLNRGRRKYWLQSKNEWETSQAEIIGSVDEGKKFLAINRKSPRADAIKRIFQRKELISEVQ
jgi:hypothetical protein